MNFRGHSNHELAAETTRSKGLGNRFSVGLHVFNDLGHYRSDSAQSRLGRRGQPTQARQLGAKSDVLLVFFRPRYAIGIPVTFFRFHVSAFRWP